MPAVAVRHERKRQEKRLKRPSQLYLGGQWMPPPQGSPPTPSPHGHNSHLEPLPELYLCGKVIPRLNTHTHTQTYAMTPQRYRRVVLTWLCIYWSRGTWWCATHQVFSWIISHYVCVSFKCHRNIKSWKALTWHRSNHRKHAKRKWNVGSIFWKFIDQNARNTRVRCLIGWISFHVVFNCSIWLIKYNLNNLTLCSVV